ncbi:MAG: TolC family protein [Sideroxydans sp.]|nr:TolC family protein [Sideroxydans sp.]
MKSIHRYCLLAALGLTAPVSQAASNYPDLPPHEQVDAALDQHVSVLNAHSQLQVDQIAQRRRNSGDYEFTLRGGMYEDYFFNSSGREGYRDWEVALERSFRLPNKMMIDREIGTDIVERGENALGDARHEASRSLLQTWFNWQRERAQVEQWGQQVNLLQQQAAMTEKRIKAGDAPRMELNQVNAATALASIASQQARLRADLAANELTRQFGAIKLPTEFTTTEPTEITQGLSAWRQIILKNNHELGMVEAETRIQTKLSDRANAERLPDPTLGIRYASQLNHNQRISGVYFSIPLPSGSRSAIAEQSAQAAQIATDREQSIKRRLEGDIYTAYTRAENTYKIWQQARDAAVALRQNAELVSRAYSLGESSLSETLVARRQALESSLAESIAQLDANEAHYRLLLDAHQLWVDNDHHEAH